MSTQAVHPISSAVSYNLQPETVAAVSAVPPSVVNGESARIGVKHGEPLLVIADALLRYAKAYKARFEGNVIDDGVGGEAFRDMVRGVKVFLDFDGGAALELGRTTDTKDNAAMCAILEAVCREAGIDWDNL